MTQTQQPVPMSMQAAALDRFGGPEVLTLHTLPVPAVADDEVLLRVHTAGVGIWDAMHRDGTFAPEGSTFPMIPGADGAGTVVAVGKQVRGVAAGDVVYAYAYARPKGGFYAEYVATKADWIAPLPASLSIEQAGAMPTDALTALSGLDTLDLPAGSTLLIFGASGGMGHLALQLAKRQGLKVAAVASGDDGVALVKQLGADLALDGHADATGMLDKLRDFAPQGVDGLLAAAGGDALGKLFTVVRQGGRIAYPHGVQSVPQSSNGVEMKAYDGEINPDQLKRLNDLIAAGPFVVHIARRFPLSQAAQAHKELQQHYPGKLVLSVE